MVGGKNLVEEKVLFTTGKFLGSAAAIMLFSLIFSSIINKLNFDIMAFLVVLAYATALHCTIQWMVKKRWL